MLGQLSSPLSVSLTYTTYLRKKSQLISQKRAEQSERIKCVALSTRRTVIQTKTFLSTDNTPATVRQQIVMRRACNVFIQVVLGPSLIYFFLLGHVAYQIYKDPDELKTQAWPAHTTKAEKEAIIKGRKPLINGILDLAGS